MDLSWKSECIEWAGAKRNGYGVRSINGRVVGAHRAAWQEVHGSIPVGLFVLHICDNRGCVNVDHLFLGTSKDNLIDAQRKGRRPVAKLGISHLYLERPS